MSANQTATTNSGRADGQTQATLSQIETAPASYSSSVTSPATGGSPQAFDVLLRRFLSTTILDNEWRFFVNGEPLAAEMLLGSKMLFAPILWNAEKSHQLLCGKPMGVNFRSDPESAVGATAVIEDVPGRSRSMYPLFCLEVLCHALENFTLDSSDLPVSGPDVRENILLGRKVPPRGTACSLDHLVTGFYQDHDLGIVPWSPDSIPRGPYPG